MRKRHAAGLLALLLHGSQRFNLLSVWSFMKSSIKLEQNLLASWSRHMRDFWNPVLVNGHQAKKAGDVYFHIPSIGSGSSSSIMTTTFSLRIFESILKSSG